MNNISNGITWEGWIEGCDGILQLRFLCSIDKQFCFYGFEHLLEKYKELTWKDLITFLEEAGYTFKFFNIVSKIQELSIPANKSLLYFLFWDKFDAELRIHLKRIAEASIEELPLYINEESPKGAFARWRLKTGW